MSCCAPNYPYAWSGWRWSGWVAVQDSACFVGHRAFLLVSPPVFACIGRVDVGICWWALRENYGSSKSAWLRSLGLLVWRVIIELGGFALFALANGRVFACHAPCKEKAKGRARLTLARGLVAIIWFGGWFERLLPVMPVAKEGQRARRAFWGTNRSPVAHW